MASDFMWNRTGAVDLLGLLWKPLKQSNLQRVNLSCFGDRLLDILHSKFGSCRFVCLGFDYQGNISVNPIIFPIPCLQKNINFVVSVKRDCFIKDINWKALFLMEPPVHSASVVLGGGNTNSSDYNLNLIAATPPMTLLINGSLVFLPLIGIIRNCSFLYQEVN